MFYLYFYIISSAFRRLQDKTQVFPLDKSDFVRTRLTHSVEVSTIARQLGIMITRNNTKYLPPEFKENKYNEVEKIPSILSCAGLLHDIGNPPFGHFGEVVIGDWFQKELEKDNFIYKGKSIKNVLNEQMRKDLCHFEGNAQALRILSKISNKEVSHEINLTKGVISALINQGYDVDKAKLLIGDLEKRIEKAENNNIECIEEWKEGNLLKCSMINTKSTFLFKEIDKNPENHLIIHYSCESFYGIIDGHTPRITSIAVYAYATAQTDSFSIHKTAEKNHVQYLILKHIMMN